MDEVARLPIDDRTDLFVLTGTARGLTSEMIEKDFWVCWTLKRIFTLPESPAGLLFKGGTSLSKVFDVIERFSEDVDLSFNRAELGFGGEDDPLNAPSRKQRGKGLKALKQTCQRVLVEEFLPKLEKAFQDALNGASTDWSLELAEDDPDQQTLLFRYPAAVRTHSKEELAYVRPNVRIEIGARSEHWPVQDAIIKPYAAMEHPKAFKEPECPVRVLAAERTFWEKVTVLHMWYHTPETKPFRDRQSRHYYDVVRLYQHELGRKATADTELLLKVAHHKNVFFESAQAKYSEAKPGTLRIVPPDARIPELKQDYSKMQEMIYGEQPTFEELLDVLRELEDSINHPDRVEEE